MPSYPKTICSRCNGVNKTSTDKCTNCHRVCPLCGSKKSRDSKNCRKCYAIEQSLNPSLTARLRTPETRKKALDSLNEFFAETKPSKIKKCPTCKSEYTSRKGQVYCTHKCALQANAAKRRKRKQKECAVCQKVFEYYPYRESKYCSRSCWNDRKEKLYCVNCGELIKSYTAKKFCSQQCQATYFVGENAPAWKGGKSLERERLRLGRQVKDWRFAVYARDGYTCQECGAKGDLHAHHVKPWAKYPKLRFDINNGITLCIDCHGKVHGRDFRKRNKKICPVCQGKMTGRGKTCRRCFQKFKKFNQPDK